MKLVNTSIHIQYGLKRNDYRSFMNEVLFGLYTRCVSYLFASGAYGVRFQAEHDVQLSWSSLAVVDSPLWTRRRSALVGNVMGIACAAARVLR